jgi:hypothetical protein
MQTVEIPPHLWTARLDEFTRMHERWLVSLDVFDAGGGVRRQMHDLPLLGVSAERVAEAGTIVVSAGRSFAEHITHIVQGVTRVSIERTDEGADAALTLESSNAAKTVLRFRATALPETVDGIPRQ